MKTLILVALSCMLLLSCKKENTTPQPVENSNQVLAKIIKTADYGGATFSFDYAYNSAGKLIKEGTKTYERDEQQRIVRILDPNTGSNRADVQVHYSPKNINQVDYTFCKMTNIDAADSVVYLHDDNGRLIKTMYYITYYNDPAVPAIAMLYEYEIFKNDADGNIQQVDNYKIDYKGQVVHCGAYLFMNYDKGINPLYTGDEVRAVDFDCGSISQSFYGVINNSINNFTGNNSYLKLYEYRADGRPRTCLVQQGGNNVFRLVYEYK